MPPGNGHLPAEPPAVFAPHPPPQPPHPPPQRGLDGGLARALPSDFDGKQSNYRDYRRRVELFQKLCKRRGTECTAEGALTLLQCLPTAAWEATKYLDLAEVEKPHGFDLIIKALDKLHRYDDSVEAPMRCTDYFEKFARKPGETINEFQVRERDMRHRLSEVGIDLPEAVSGWIVLSRSGIPAWQEPQVRALCGGTLTPDRVFESLKQLYGGDHQAERRDARRAAGRAR